MFDHEDISRLAEDTVFKDHLGFSLVALCIIPDLPALHFPTLGSDAFGKLKAFIKSHSAF